MGLNTGSNVKYWFKVKEGQLVHSNKKKNEFVEGKSYTGKLVGIGKSKSEWEGKVTDKFFVRMQDGDELVNIEWSQDTYFTANFFSMIEQVNLDKPFTFSAYQSKKVESKASFCGLFQDGKSVTRNEQFPKPNKVMVNRKETLDYTPVLDACEPIYLKLEAKFGKIEFKAVEKPIESGLKTNTTSTEQSSAWFEEENIPF